MSKYKTYILDKMISQYSLQIHNKYITFKTIGFGSRYSTGKPQYSTKDADEQQGIESSRAYKDGKIKLIKEVDIEPQEKAKTPVKKAKAPVAPKKVAKAPKPPVVTDEPEDEGPDEDGLENLDVRNLDNLDDEGMDGADTEEGLEDLDGDGAHDPAVYDEITKFRDAQAILTSPPYNVPKTSTELRSKEAIHAKAGELGISFPNLI